jgi:C4-dicarboxylate transporter, DctM subunit
MVVNLALGMITPPFGVNLFAACAVARISVDQIVRQLLPFVGVIVACLAAITYVPTISLALRDIVYPPAVQAPAIGPSAAATIGPAAAIGPTPAPATAPAPAIGPQ